MKEYLKMSDVFVGEYKPKRRIDAWPPSRWGETLVELSGSPAQYAAHAINSHDELVQMNQELLAALKQVVSDVRVLADHSYGVHGLHQNGDLAPWNSLFSGGFFESWLLSVDDADAVIAKTEGGAA